MCLDVSEFSSKDQNYLRSYGRNFYVNHKSLFALFELIGIIVRFLATTSKENICK